MTTYRPILKGKQGELAAISHVSSDISSQLAPIIEIMPNKGRDSDLESILQRAGKFTNRNFPIAIDMLYIDDLHTAVNGTEEPPMAWLCNRLREKQISTLPVFRSNDSPDFLSEVGAIARRDALGACLRVGDPEADPDPDTLTKEVPAALGRADLSHGEVDLIIDLSEVRIQKDLDRATAAAREVIQWTRSSDAWRTVTIASGAFPASISHLQRNTSTALPRYDAQLWQLLDSAYPEYELDFGDFAISNPIPAVGAPRGPLPNLRYTDGAEWHVYRRSRSLPGNSDFFIICQDLVESNHWPTTGELYSWGDREINRCAQQIGGAGTATQWLSYGFSRHLAHVLDRLATHNVP